MDARTDVPAANALIEAAIADARTRLVGHPLLTGRGVRSLADLCRFMESHVYAVWDFMSLLKALQGALAPTSVPWLPPEASPAVVRMINEIVLIEESDSGPVPGTTLSHTDLYLMAMDEVGADTATFRSFLERVGAVGVRAALKDAPGVPAHARVFVGTTFDVIERGVVWEIAAAFTFGRETVIPPMFRNFLDRFSVTSAEAPAFHYYLDRHIEVDEGEHGPAARRMLDDLCGMDTDRIAAAESAAEKAVCDRIIFWDGVAATLEG